MNITRRRFIQQTSVLAVAATTLPTPAAESASPSSSKLPRWRGFNLLEKFTKRREGNPPFQEADFAVMQEWGFSFARLPMSYLCWCEADPANWQKLRDEELGHIDQAVEFGRKCGVHVNLNFHRAPGYCVNPPREPLDLWKDQEALDACSFHWARFAKRYKGIPNRDLSFDLLNEPPQIDEAAYVRVVKALVAAIRSEDPQRLIIADGLRWGLDPVHGLADLGVAQSTRGYSPMEISHYKASWINGSDKWPEPTWPLKKDGRVISNKTKLQAERIEPWKKLEERGVGVHVGEWGAFHQTPHPVVLAWMRDYLDLWKAVGWGWALWNLRGSFGVLDSQRTDVQYEDFRGHKLDRAMLDLLRAG